MKSLVLKMLMAVALLASCFVVMAQPKAIAGNTTIKQKAELSAAAKVFFNWYKQTYPRLSKIELVKKTGKNNSYRVQWKQVDTFLTILENSQLFNNEFIVSWMQFFRARDEHFENNPQTSGEPLGFEYDLILLTQEPAKVLTKVSGMKISDVNYTEGYYMVETEVMNWYRLYFKKSGGKWKISDIANSNEE